MMLSNNMYVFFQSVHDIRSIEAYTSYVNIICIIQFFFYIWYIQYKRMQLPDQQRVESWRPAKSEAFSIRPNFAVNLN